MFGIRNPFRSTELRAADIDVGQLYSAFFAFGGASYSWQVSPAVLAASLSVPGGTGALYTEARRLSRVSPLLTSYLRCMEGGILTGEPERPQFGDDVTERVADRRRRPVGRPPRPATIERDILRLHHDRRRMPAAGRWDGRAGDRVRARLGRSGVGEARRRAIGSAKGAAVRREGLMYLGDRRQGEERADGWIFPSLPYVAALVNTRISSGHALGALAKIASTIINTSPDRIVAGSGARTGIVHRETDNNAAGDQPITSTGIGSVVYLRQGEQYVRAVAGPDKTAQDYESILEADAAAALNLPLSELKSDYRSGSFSNLQMAHFDASAEYRRRRVWWHRRFRVQIWHALLRDSFASGKLPRMRREEMAALRRPSWPGPHRESPQPTKDMLAYAKLVEAGVIDAATAAEQLEL